MKFFKPRGRGSLIGLQSPGYQLIWGKVDEYAEHIAELSGHTRERVESVLKEVRSALENRIWRLIPYPKYDYSWALLHQVRALLCQEIPLPRLVASVVDEIAGADGLMTHAKIRNVHTGERRDLAATGIFIFVGFKPNTGIIDGHVDHDASGYLITDTSMETSLRGLFAAGDVRAQLTRQVTTAVGDATTAAIAVEKYLTARRNGTAAPAPAPILVRGPR